MHNFLSGFIFFTQTPSATQGELDFYPIHADFGTATQEFHIGMGSIAAAAFAIPMVAPGRMAKTGEFIYNPDLADTFEALVRYGPQWFYAGEPAQRLARDCIQLGGLISAADMRSYERHWNHWALIGRIWSNGRGDSYGRG